MIAKVLKQGVEAIHRWWARSVFTIALAVLGYYIGTVQTESRIAADCRFAAAFRVDIQAFTCQRKL
jgi:hypothetical protein